MQVSDRGEQPDNWQSLGSILAGLAPLRLPVSATVLPLAARRPADVPAARPQPQAA